MIHFEVIDNGEGGHNDILFSVDGLLQEQEFDTYYLILETNCETFRDVTNAVSRLIIRWKAELENFTENLKAVYLPIDFSDEYTGCLKVVQLADSLELSYGCTKNRDFDKFSEKVDDFENTENRKIKVSKADLLSCLNCQVEKLKSAG